MAASDDPVGTERKGRRAVAVIAVAALLSLSALAAAGSAAAIDQIAVVSPDRSQTEVAPGETVEIDVALESGGGHGGEGVDAVTLIVQYNPEYIEITDVQRGPWLEGEGTEVHATETIAHDQGTAIVAQRREPAAGGTSGTGTIATLTVRVADDAPAGTTDLSFDQSEVRTTGDWPVAVVDETATIAVDGGGEPLASFDHPDPDDLERVPGNSSAGNDSSEPDGETTATGDGAPVPGMTMGLTFAAIALAGLLWAAVRHGPRK